MSALAKTQTKKAQELIAQAEAVLKKKSWFSSSQEKNYEEGAELYAQAANAYKVGGLPHEAGAAYEKAGSIYRDKLNNVNEAAKSYSLAATSYKKSNGTDAVSAYQSSIALLTDAGRLTQAAKLCKECAELYENEEAQSTDNEKSNVVLAIEYYEQASELFGLEDSKSQVNNCLTKIAELCSAALDPPDLLRASQLYDQLGRNCLESNLLKFNAKGYFLQNILCQLANRDAVGAEQALQQYEGIDYTFTESREGKFAITLVDAVNAMDVEALSTACFDYDRISKLDPWKTSMLVTIKRSIQDNDGGGDNDDDEVDLT